MNKNAPAPFVYQQFVQLETDDVLERLNTSSKGLTSSQVKTLRTQHGLNILHSNQISWLTIFIRQFRSPFIYILLGAALLAYLLGELIDGTIILMFVLINAVLGFYQEYRSEQALKVLNQYTTPHAHVIRNGVEEVIPTPELVPGDVLLLQPGDIVPADVRLLEASNFAVDESVLTGESIASQKDETGVTIANAPLHKVSNIAFSGSNVITGKAQGVVVATGLNAYIGTIAKITLEMNRTSSFEKGMNLFSDFVLKMVGVTLFLVFFANLLVKGPAANLGDMILFIIALAAAVIPEALPLVVTFSLSRGAIRLSKHKVVVKRLSAIEDLGGIEVLCTDKTGTITENALSVADIYGDANTVLAQASTAISQHNNQLDSFDKAILEAYKKTTHRSSLGKLIHEIPFDPERKRNSVLVHSGDKEMLIVRGAADAILCHLSATDRKIISWIKTQEEQGRRVIVVASRTLTQQTEEYSQDMEETGLNLTGALAFTDPLKKSAITAVKKAQKLGVTIKIITGDGAVVAGSIAHQIGLVESSKEVVTAEEFFALPPKQQRLVAEKTHVFARFSPVQKHQLIDMLQQHHEVGFIGDGINDAPALKTANVALVVQGASDIAREAADVILLNSSLSVIVDGIQEGREVFANTIKYVKITLASNFGNFYAIAIVTLFIEFLPMLPVQILLVNLLSDFPLIAVATDAVDQSDIAKPEGYNLKELAFSATIFGIISSAFDFVFFGTFYRISPQVLQTNWFIGSILTEFILLYSLRTKKPFFKAVAPSKTIIILTLLAAAVTIIIPYTTIGQSIFHFVAPSFYDLILILIITLIYFILNEVAKVTYYKFADAKNPRDQK